MSLPYFLEVIKDITLKIREGFECTKLAVPEQADPGRIGCIIQAQRSCEPDAIPGVISVSLRESERPFIFPHPARRAEGGITTCSLNIICGRGFKAAERIPSFKKRPEVLDHAHFDHVMVEVRRFAHRLADNDSAELLCNVLTGRVSQQNIIGNDDFVINDKGLDE